MAERRPFDPTDALRVMTIPKAPPDLIERSQARAAELGLEWVRRDRGVKTVLARHGASLAYVVSREKEMLTDGERSLFMHPGLFYLKQGDGRTHPLIRALSPEGAPPVRRVIDATLGLAGDALHVAAVLDVEILGIEASPILASLVREGLERVARERRRWRRPASAITVRQGQALDVLQGLGDGAADVVYLDPMFVEPLGAQPGFDLLRLVADASQPSSALLAEAARVALRRVVVKVGGAAPPPAAAPPPPGWNHWVRGGAVDYHVLEKAGFDPGPEGSS